MAKTSFTKDFLLNDALLETETGIHTGNSGDETIQTISTRLADSYEEETINIRELDLHDLERIHNQDRFMYHSIVQHVRKMRSSAFASDLHGLDDELDWPGSCPADTAAGSLNPGSILRHTAYVDINRGTATPALNAQASNESLQPLSAVTRQPRRPSSSSQPVPSSCSSHGHEPSSQNSPVQSTGVVTRKRRLSVETDCRQEMADLVASFPSTSRSDMDSMFEFDNDTDSYLDAVDLSFLGLE
ncbi:hypothetical protein ACHAWX_006469 [Stephanocyclus meneghinianus]